MDNRIIPAIVSVMVLILLGVALLVWMQFRPVAEIRYDVDGDAAFSGPAVDSGARIEIEGLRAQLEALTEQMQQLEKQIATVAANVNRAPATSAPVVGQDQPAFQTDGPNQIIDAYAQVVLIANRRELNKGVNIASPRYLEGVFGKPRDVLTDKCQGMTNERLASKLVTAEVGPIRVTMLQPAIDSLGVVFDKIKAADKDLYDRINTAGALCVRHIRGAPNSTSTHAFGLSVDLNIDGRLDSLGDGRTQLGLTILADFFRNEGWYWGAGFGREDSMHFEVSRDLVEKWIAEGKL
ncbi:M15 family metallopeptidase [Pseudosulfitobacter koreensis]|uniref:M15 family metallopeptidase n=1 Tax=Pseudosulfitobacter koreensis TaxID=2968472 RepID=A0ABT1Z2K7_9RHOB|nr:M15 family metallopeptidase [Pseudosulfitobacter koreense]MCR8827372.1 M15 family metallopeptidase [Pseudosulfitobacter koreense]